MLNKTGAGTQHPIRSHLKEEPGCILMYEEVGAYQIPGASARQGSCKAGIEGFFGVLARYSAAHMGHWARINPFPQPRSQATRKHHFHVKNHMRIYDRTGTVGASGGPSDPPRRTWRSSLR